MSSGNLSLPETFITAVGKLWATGRIDEEDCPVTMQEVASMGVEVLTQHECYEDDPRAFIHDLLQVIRSAEADGHDILAAIRVWLQNSLDEIDEPTDVLN